MIDLTHTVLSLGARYPELRIDQGRLERATRVAETLRAHLGPRRRSAPGHPCGRGGHRTSPAEPGALGTRPSLPWSSGARGVTVVNAGLQ